MARRPRRNPARSGRSAPVIVLLLFLAIGAVAPMVSATNLEVTSVSDSGRTVTRGFPVTVDTTAPTLTLAAPDATASIDVTISGTATDENDVDDVVLTYDGSEMSIPVDADGNYSATVSLPEGETTITVEAADEFGNTDTAATTVVVDRTAPTLERHSPLDYVDTRSPVVSISRTDDLTGVNATLTTLRFDGADVTSRASLDGSKLIYRPTNLSEGTHTITASATDLVGNENTVTWTFTVDTTAPRIDSATADPADGVSPDDPLTVRVEAGDDTGVASVTAAGTPLLLVDGTWTGSVTPALALGDHDLPVVARDRVGNVDRTTLHYVVGHERDADLVAREAALDPSGPELRRLSIHTKPGIDARTVTVTSAVSERNPAANLPEGERSIYFAQIDTSLANDDINDSRVRVRVSRSELASASLDAETVRLWVAEGGDWHALETTRLGPSGTTLTYSAAVPHFSTFAVTARSESVPPTIRINSPDETGEVSPTAPIVANYSDADSGVDTSTVRVLVDGSDVTGNATIGPDGFRYATTFESGKHHARVSVNDTMGNNATRRWDFIVEGPDDSSAGAARGGDGSGGGDLSPPSVLSSAAKTGPDEVAVTIRNGRAGTESRTLLPDFGSSDVGYDSFALRFARDDPKIVMRLSSTDAPAAAPGGTETLDYLGFSPKYATAADVADATVGFTVRRDALPAGSTLDDVVVHAYRDGTWIELDVPHEGNTFEASVSDLSTLAIGVERRASVSVTRIDGPGNVTAGDPTGITATVANAGSKRTTADVTLSVDGTALATRSVDVGPNEEATVSFEHTFGDAGDHQVAVNGRSKTIPVFASGAGSDSMAKSNTTPTPITQSKTEGQDGFGFLVALFSIGICARRFRK